MKKPGKLIYYLLPALTFICCIIACNNNSESNPMNDTITAKGITQSGWGEIDGKKVYLFTLTNKNGEEVKITNYGGTVISWVMADKKGNRSSIVLGFDNLKGYQAPPPYFGATIGRYGNRIANGKFSLDGKVYILATNNGKNHLHGGIKGFDKVVWDVAPLADVTPSLTLTYLSKDGEEGYPGNLKVSVKFTLTDSNALKIEYDAETDKSTPINLTNHSYFNLTGDVTNTIADHLLMIDADKYTPVDSTLIPTGELLPVAGTPFDFRRSKKIGADLEKVTGGYDHNFVLNKKGISLEKVAVLGDSISGRQIEVYTTEPGLQFYSGNFLDGSLKTSDGKPIRIHTGLCLETQHYPDSPNEPTFPSTILKPGEKYHTVTKYQASLMK